MTFTRYNLRKPTDAKIVSDKVKTAAAKQDKRYNMYGGTVLKAMNKYCGRGSGFDSNPHSQTLCVIKRETIS
jgi:hypothetical protein